MDIAISQANRDGVAKELKVLLADEFLLYTKTRNAHWNVVGHDFYDKHLLFETLYLKSGEVVDEVAERIRQLGHVPPASLKEYLAMATLNEFPSEALDSETFIRALLGDHEQIIRMLRANIKKFAEKFHDMGTSDFITQLMEAHEKTAWLLRSHVYGS
ncbi:Dps family protein [Flagellimonas beolgyonensis]|uniref:Dps family protein n=1 Tax=Flagellimonas beolgyonensis TaxID=864064 RepID=UPI003D65C6F9